MPRRERGPSADRISRRACRRWRSPASARCPTSPRRTTGSGAISPSMSGSPSGSRGAARGRPRLRRGLRLRRARAKGATEVVGVDANPEAHEHARLRYTRPNLRFERDLVESYAGPCDAIVFLQTIEHIQDPGALLDGFARAAEVSYISTPNLLTLAPEGAEKSDNPWHLREYTAAEYAELLEPRFSEVEIYGVFHARKLRVHEVAIAAGWDRVHKALRITKPFYDRFIPAISASDFAIRPALERRSERSARLPRRLPAMSSAGRRGRSGSGPPQPHALRRGLRHLSVRGGVAFRRGDPFLRARSRRRRWPDDDRDSGARRSARGGRRRRAAARLPARVPDRLVRGRPRRPRAADCAPHARRRGAAMPRP